MTTKRRRRRAMRRDMETKRRGEKGRRIDR
jgi:hypothetical protein